MRPFVGGVVTQNLATFLFFDPPNHKRAGLVYESLSEADCQQCTMSNRVPCVTAILYNSQGQVLLYQRDNKANLSFPGYWSTLGGAVEAEETPIDAIRRELQEEIELEVPVEFWKVYERPHSSGITVVQYVFVGYLDQPITEMVLNEGQALAYFEESELAPLPIGFGFKTLLQEFFRSVELERKVNESPNPRDYIN